ncbi:MAG: hypothetical protein M3Y82_05200, partial [Verrucomicrobiota bacterium]|nr:hypothetical protein [Verrucomicrobiota bacterium]
DKTAATTAEISSPKFGNAENSGFALSSLALYSVCICLTSLEPLIPNKVFNGFEQTLKHFNSDVIFHS